MSDQANIDGQISEARRGAVFRALLALNIARRKIDDLVSRHMQSAAVDGKIPDEVYAKFNPLRRGNGELGSLVERAAAVMSAPYIDREDVLQEHAPDYFLAADSAGIQQAASHFLRQFPIQADPANDREIGVYHENIAAFLPAKPNQEDQRNAADYSNAVQHIYESAEVLNKHLQDISESAEALGDKPKESPIKWDEERRLYDETLKAVASTASGKDHAASVDRTSNFTPEGEAALAALGKVDSNEEFRKVVIEALRLRAMSYMSLRTVKKSGPE